MIAGMTPLYVLLGIATSGRRAFLSRLLPECRDDETAPLLLWTAASDPAAPAADEALAAVPGLIRATWSMADERITAEVPKPAAPPAAAFLIGDGLADPRDLLEALPLFMSANDLRIARIFCWIDAAAVHETPKLKTWYAVAAHFSDAILIQRLPAVPNKVYSNLENHLDQERHPGLRYFFPVGKLPPIDELLYPEARRLTTWFDTLAYNPHEAETPVGSWPIEGSADALAEDEDDPDAEPLFERDAHGRRTHPVPDVSKLKPPTA